MALLGALGIGDGVVERGCFGQAGKHRDLAKRQLVERLAEVRLRGRAETIGALAKVNLVDVELEDLLLVQAVLDLEGEERLVQLAGERLLRGKKEITRHLHGDGARALAPAAIDEIGVGGTQHADVIDPRMLVEALVLGGDDGVLQLRRDVGDRDDRAALFAELTNQRAVR